MDIKKLAEIVANADEPVTITIYQPNGDPYLALDGSESTIDVVGSESKKYKAAKRQITNRLMNKRRAKVSAEDVEKNAIFLAAAAVTNWHGWDDGKSEIPPTPENVRDLLEVEHIRDQVEDGIRGHADFFSNASEN